LISKSTIDQVYETARVEEVIGDFVQLKKSGANYKGLSPFSDERTPSFMVSPVKQIWKDFSSGKGGNVVAFIMEHEHFSYPEAIKYLAKKYNIEIEETEQTDEQKKALDEMESMYLLSEYAQNQFSKTLWEHPLGKSIGLTYFKERGFTDETIKSFHLGYCLDNWDDFTNKALEDKYQLEYLEKTGLSIVKKSEDGTSKNFDRFKGRVMFPIHSMSGRVLGFGGRILKKDPKAAKYLNSPESPIYHKSKVLYGIYHAKASIAKQDNCYLVEGYTDVIQFHQRGIHNVVSSSGTALTPDQIRLINRLTKNITVLFDGDAAGLRASLRGIDLILAQGMNVKVCSFPDGEDPDSFAKNNSLEEVQSYLDENSKDFIGFKASLFAEESKDDPIKRAQTIREIVESIAKIPDTIQREVYIQSCAKIMEVSEAVLFDSLAQITKKDYSNAQKLASKTRQEAFKVVKHKPEEQKLNVLVELERKIIELLLLYGSHKDRFKDEILDKDSDGNLVHKPVEVDYKVYEKIYLDLQQDEIEFSQPHFKTIYYQLIQGFNQNEDFKVQHFINTQDQEFSSMLSSILMEDEKYLLNNWESKNIFPKEKDHSIAQLTTETILTLRCNLISRRIEELKQQTREEEANIKSLLEEIMDFQKLLTNLSKRLNRVLVA